MELVWLRELFKTMFQVLESEIEDSVTWFVVSILSKDIAHSGLLPIQGRGGGGFQDRRK
jgi:hypothetical protein